MPEPLKQGKLVLVEGKDEVNFFSAIRDHVGLVDIEVRSFDGVDNLRGTLQALKGVEGFERLVSLGIVRDADGNGAAALQSVQDALQSAGLPSPATGLQRAGQNPLVVILVNPHEQADGRFDDVCSESVRTTPVMNCVERYHRMPQGSWTRISVQGMEDAGPCIYFCTSPTRGLPRCGGKAWIFSAGARGFRSQPEVVRASWESVTQGSPRIEMPKEADVQTA